MCQFSRKPKKGKKYKGVFRVRNSYGKVYIIAKIRNIYLGAFFNERLAAIAYNKAALKLFGDKAFLNIIDQS